MMNKVNECIPLLEEFIKARYMPSIAHDFLTRCLYAEGYTPTEFMDSIDHQTNDSIAISPLGTENQRERFQEVDYQNL